MVSKLRRGVLGSRERSEPKECWQIRMGGRSGFVNSARIQMCGRGGVASDGNIPSSLQVHAGGRCKIRRMIHRLFDVKWERRQKAQSLEAENKELRARIDGLEKKEGVQRGQSIPSREGSDSEDVWGEFMEVENEAETRRKLDEQKKKLQKELRDVDRLSFVTKEVQESIMESVQHQLQEVEKRRHDLMPEHQKFQKRSQKIQKYPGQEEPHAEGKCRSGRRVAEAT